MLATGGICQPIQSMSVGRLWCSRCRLRYGHMGKCFTRAVAILGHSLCSLGLLRDMLRFPLCSGYWANVHISKSSLYKLHCVHYKLWEYSVHTLVLAVVGECVACTAWILGGRLETHSHQGKLSMSLLQQEKYFLLILCMILGWTSVWGCHF